MNLLKKSKESDELAYEAWKSILSKHYEYVDKDSFDEFVNEIKRDVKWDCELAIMNSAMMLASLGQESGWLALKEIGIEGDLKKVEQKIKGRITNHELKQNTKEEESAKVVDFYVMMAQIRKQGYSVTSDVLLIEWDGILRSIKEENERANIKK